MKKADCSAFVNILDAIHEKGITTKTALKDDQLLYDEFWFAVKDFCHFALLSRTGGRNAENKILPGNSGKIRVLESRGAATREEIETECVIRIIRKLDRVLRQPVGKQKNYCYKICNNMVNDCFRKLPPEGFENVSLNSAAGGAGAGTEDAYTYGEILADDTYNPERLLIERETVRELRKDLRARREKESAGKREAILRETASLSGRPAEVLARLACTHLNMKPGRLAGMIIDKGCKNAYAEVISEVARKNDIELSKFRNIAEERNLTAESVKAETNSREKVAAQISRLIYRADERLSR